MSTSSRNSTTSSDSGAYPDMNALQKHASVKKMLVSASVGILPSVGAGATMAFSTTAASQYRIANTTSLYEPLDDEQSSWFVSILLVALMFGILSSGLLSSKFGYKICLIIGCLVQAFGWIMLYFAPSFTILLIGRLVAGLGSGLCTPASYVYVSDIALIRFRGMLTTLNSVVINCAFLMSFILGAVVPFSYMIPLSSVPLVFFFIFCWKWLQESPTWLIKNHRIQDAAKSLMEIRGPHYEVEGELHEIEGVVFQEADNPTYVEQFKYCISRAVLMPLGITLVLFAFQATCGADTVTYYSLDIFSTSKVDINPYIMAILLQGSFTIGYALSAPLMDRMRKKVQFVMSGSIMVVSYQVLGFCLYFKDDVKPDTALARICSFLAPACVIISALGYSLGFGPVAYSLNGEILPPRVRGICCSLVLATRFVLVFAQLKVFPSLVENLGLATVFWIHSLICFAATAFACLFLPETQGKTLAELSTLYVKKLEKESKLNLTKEQEADFA